MTVFSIGQWAPNVTSWPVRHLVLDVSHAVLPLLQAADANQGKSDVLGGQIAWHSAFKGKTVAVYDPFPEAMEKAKAAHAIYAGIYKADLGARDADIEGARVRLSYHAPSGQLRGRCSRRRGRRACRGRTG
jgi:hypothetical protein